MRCAPRSPLIVERKLAEIRADGTRLDTVPRIQ
jgi:hypothetical protein